jgi:23S rRNA pseudouridine2605 synthase
MNNLRGHERRIGLARVLSKLGHCSRSRAVELIREGRVRLNGIVQHNPEAPVRIGKDHIESDGEPIEKARKLYLAVNKPRGIVTTAADEKGRETIYSLLPPNWPWIAPVGRLDKASEGLLLLTNDSEWAAKILDPASHLEKTYHVQLEMVADDRLTQTLENGIREPSGELLRAKRAAFLRGGKKNCWLEIVLDEGKNRQIRRMFAALEMDVLRLVRVAIGPVVLGNIPKGKWRELTAQEREALKVRTSAKTNLRKFRA